jgi:sugar O-acyltransferase (sialic acid O-acetyltransferase NeuD family)
VQLGAGSVVFAGAVIQPDVKIGNHCIINTATTIDHDCVLGDYVHLAPGVHLAGNVSIDEGCFLGIGSVVIPGIKIGSKVTVAAGGVVVNHVACKKTIMGIPAKERGVKVC